ncbi:DUF4129 domain-containing protein [filamentous cyanobacterium LEGE 11480]|uniref:DUF4129 domain-containing protein n=1 Tax=Romeriopsis navalis LEGE 11480 TaxID=2777977 RepID=A0A928VQA8_9CYAN|nr:DUF4129 domain-containing protein [Romeriopsis navalis]MBE9031782.1 DUF4129 domain-containing protein [Romeriopsis navalis LEGE 11480]
MSKFQESNLGWQFRQTQQRFAEWLEWVLNQPRQGTPRNPNDPWALRWLAPYLTWIFGILLLGLLGFILVRALSNWRVRRLEGKLAQNINAPPSELAVSLNEWLQRAQQFQQQGNFTQAGRSLYFAMLQNLHDREIIPEKRSRTDQEYDELLQQLSQEFVQAEAFSQLLQTHERIEFAGGQLSAQDYDRCQQAYGETVQAIATVESIDQSATARQGANGAAVEVD